MLILLIGGPILITTLLVGLLVSTFQAMTQIQEQTLTFIPKLIAVGIVLVVLGPWMLQNLLGFTSNLFSNLANLANF